MSDEYDNDRNVRIARLGIEAEAFMSSPLGLFLQGKAASEVEALTAELIDADPEDAKVNRDIRNKIHVCRMFSEWLGDGINAGLAALHQLREAENDPPT